MTGRITGSSAPLQADGQPDLEAMAAALADFLRAAGVAGAAAGQAPQRSARAWAEELLAGYRQDPGEILAAAWPDRSEDLVVLRDIPFVSVCAHHLLPFYGTAHLAYLPAGRVVGLSRLAELISCLSRRLQVQERLSEEIVEAVMQGLAPAGVACLLEAEHDCVGARSLEYRSSLAQTVAYRGAFAERADLREHFLQLVLGRRGSGGSPPGPPPVSPAAGGRAASASVEGEDE